MPQLPKFLLVAAVSLFLHSCSGGSGDGAPGPATPAQVAQLRFEAGMEGVTTAPPAMSISNELFALGRALFFDKILSGNQDVACSTCHLPSFAGADGRTLPGGVHGVLSGPSRTGGDVVPRNSPSVLNIHLTQTAFWDSRVEMLPGSMLRTPAPLSMAIQAAFTPGLEVLAAQAMFPPTIREEMRGQPGENTIADLADNDVDGVWTALTARVTAIPAYQTLLGDAYPGVLLGDINFGHLANAIAAFEVRGFDRRNSPFQRFLNGDDDALNAAQVQGGLEFFGPGRCVRCHFGPGFSDSLHHNIGLPQFGPGKGDGASTLDDFGREQVTANNAHRYRFRTPTLLNVELTAPYGRLGQYATLMDIVTHYQDPTNALNTYSMAANVSDPALAGTQLSNETDVLADLSPLLQGPQPGFNAGAIVEFLRTLTADNAIDLSNLVPSSVPSGLPIDG